MEIFVNWDQQIAFRDINKAKNYYFYENTDIFNDYLNENYNSFDIFNMTGEEKEEIKKGFPEDFLESVKI